MITTPFLSAIAIVLVTAVPACEKKQSSKPPSPAAAPPSLTKEASTQEAPTQGTDPKEASQVIRFSANGIPGIALGSAPTLANVQAVFNGRTVRADELSAEGEVIGNAFYVSDGNKEIALIVLGENGTVASIRLFADAVGPGNIRPGVTTYEQARDSIGIKQCTGGAEDFGDLILCETNTPNLDVAFPDLENKYYDTRLATRNINSILAGRMIKQVTIAKPATNE